MKSFFAYVDPGIGLLAWQAVVAAFLGGLFYVRKTRVWLFQLIQRPFRPAKATAKAPAELATPPEKPPQ
jgi:hypothetical protein